MFSDPTCILPESGVKSRLSAASLVAREADLNARAAEKLNHRFADLGEEGVYQTSDKKLGCSHAYILVQKPVV